MPRLRFETVRDLYCAFPTAASDIGASPSDQDSLAFLRARIEERAWEPAIGYCAYLLPRYEAVLWACDALRRLTPALEAADAETLAIVEAWLRQPDDARRRAALDRGNLAEPRAPATWLALAVGWSGGSVVPPEHGAALAPREQTARAIRAGLMIAMAGAPRATLAEALRTALAYGLELASG